MKKISEELYNLNKILATVIKKKRKKTENLKLKNKKEIIRQKLKRIFGAYIYVNILQMFNGIQNFLEKKISSDR